MSKIRSMRQWMELLKNENHLIEINKKVDLRYELSAVGKKADGKYALQFKNVFYNGREFKIPVVTNLLNTRQLIEKAIGAIPGHLLEYFSHAQSNPMEPKIIDKNDAPVKEIINLDPNLYDLPIPIHHEKDGGQYITAGILIAKNPKTKVRNISIHRLQVLDRNKLGILILPRHLFHFFDIAEKEKQPLEVAVAIGVDPVLLLASQALAALDFDEFGIAGRLYGEPLEIVRAETVDIEVPAQAEIVLEGAILPGIREPEGPFGEYPKYYGPKSPKPVLELKAITMRSDPIYHTIIPANKEHLLLGAVPREANMLQLIRNSVPNTVAVSLSEGGVCRYHAIISIDKKNEGEAKNAIFAAFSSSHEIKHAIVVDKDIDVFNMEEVEWAIATRCQASKDIFIIPNALGNKLDPSSHNGISDKMGIDATVPLVDAASEKYEKIKIPGEEHIKLEDYI
ncbi:MAG: UbiD family decarboxylase [Thermoplasmata archaeon]